MKAMLNAAVRSKRLRFTVKALSFTLAGLVSLVVARHFMHSGFPLSKADPWLVLAAGVVFLLAHACKAYGWSRLFAPHERPKTMALATASGAAAVAGLALPGRLDDALRVAIVRRHHGCKADVRAVGLSLFTLGLVETIALSPLASTAAASADSSAIRAGLAVVAFAGLGAAGVVLSLRRIGLNARLVRYRLVRWLGEHAPTTGETSKAFVFVLGAWLLRGVGLILLLDALAMGVSLPVAMVFMCTAAASAALPIAPAGAATQAGAGAAVLIASGTTASQAVTFAVAVQALGILVGAAILLYWGLSVAGRRLAPRWSLRAAA